MIVDILLIVAIVLLNLVIRGMVLPDMGKLLEDLLGASFFKKLPLIVDACTVIFLGLIILNGWFVPLLLAILASTFIWAVESSYIVRICRIDRNLSYCEMIFSVLGFCLIVHIFLTLAGIEINEFIPFAATLYAAIRMSSSQYFENYIVRMLKEDCNAICRELNRNRAYKFSLRDVLFKTINSVNKKDPRVHNYLKGLNDFTTMRFDDTDFMSNSNKLDTTYFSLGMEVLGDMIKIYKRYNPVYSK